MLPNLRWVPSPNFSHRNGARVDLLVIHDVEGGYQGAISWFANAHSGVSAHFVLKEDGTECTQMVASADKAWHCVSFNSRSIGLEMAGFAKAGYGEAEWTAAARVVAYLLRVHQIPVQWARHTAVWASFVDRVEAEAKKADFPLQWGR